MEAKVLEAERHAEMDRRTNPTTDPDFAVLYNELSAWRKGEVVKIKVRNLLCVRGIDGWM